jgi:hypothetical protein
LKLQGDDWDTFLSRNGFVTSNPVEVPVVDKPMLEKTPIPSSNRSVLLSKEPCDRAALDEPMLDKQDVDHMLFESPKHEKDVFPNNVAKEANKFSHKLSSNNPDLGFNNKTTRRLISRSLRNKTKSHVSSIKVIGVHESSDSEIERFLEEEDPTYHKSIPNQTYDLIDNLPPFLKHNENFLGIKLRPNSMVDSGSILTHTLGYPQTTVPDPRSEVCSFWIYKYYTNIPSLKL